MKKLLAAVVVLLGLAGFSFAEEKEGVSLTIYNQDFALVKDRRTLDLSEDLNQIRFSDVAAKIDPTSVHFKSLTAPEGCVIQEQNYEYDLVSADKLLEKYLDKKIKIFTDAGVNYEGTLMSYDSANIVIAKSADNSINMVSRQDNIKFIEFSSLPEGLITKPTLMWQIATNKKGKHLVEVSYMSSGIKWNSDYVAVIDQDDKNIDLSGWVTIDNKSGATYKDAGIKLIAGEVNRVQEPKYDRRVEYKMAAMEDLGGQQFEEKPFFEYHMYSLQRKATVKDNQTKQISLLNAANIGVNKLYIYDPAVDYGWGYYQEGQNTKEQKVKIKIEIINSQKNNLGMPLPKGKVRVYKKDSDGKLEFVGEDQIDHTPKDEKVRLNLGNAFDVVGERKITEHRQGNNWSEDTVEISLRNHKDSDITVKAIEHLWRYSNWEVEQKSHEFTKTDAQTIEFNLPVAKNSETKINYKVRYWW